MTTYQYDSNRRLTDIIYPDLSTTHFDYDNRGNKYYEENQYGARTYTHDDLGRVETVTDEILAKMITYEYDQNGNRSKMIGPDGETTTYRYDALNRIKELIDPDGEKTVFFYDKAGKRESIRFPNGVRGVYLYDSANHLESIVYKNTAGDVLSSFTYTHNNVGNRMSKTFASGDSESYGYDDLHRLTTATYPNGRSVAYDYDPVGNRNFVTEAWDGGGSETTTYTYSDFNQVLTTTNSVGTTTYGWDDNGNLATRETPAAELTQYAYNFENRLIGILYPGGAANAFGYDPQGIRTFKDDSHGLHRYLIDQVSVLAEFNGSGAKKAWYTANPQRIDEIISQDQAAGKFYHLVDGLGSVYGLVNQEQVKVASYSYDAYGALTDQQVDTGVENPFLFTGRELDADSGWQYNRARYYLSCVGSWNREDPLSFRSTFGVYSANEMDNRFYYDKSPTDAIDPTGYVTITASRSLNISAIAVRGLSRSHTFFEFSFDTEGHEMYSETISEGESWGLAGDVVWANSWLYTNAPTVCNLLGPSWSYVLNWSVGTPAFLGGAWTYWVSPPYCGFGFGVLIGFGLHLPFDFSIDWMTSNTYWLRGTRCEGNSPC